MRQLALLFGAVTAVRVPGFGAVATVRVPVAPALPGYPVARFVGLLPSFRADATGCLAAHAAYCREHELDAVSLNMGLLGKFTLLVGREQVAACFQDSDNVLFKSAIDRRGVGLLTGIGVLLADGDEHTRRRRLILPSFEARQLERYVDVMSSVANATSHLVANSAEGSPIDMGSIMSAAALRIVCLSLFSLDPGLDAAAFGTALESCLEHAVWVSRSALPIPPWLPTRRNRRFRRNLQVLALHPLFV